MEIPSPPVHMPVMCKSAVGMLECRAGGYYVDSTLGGGGYAGAILQASSPDGRLLALDWDSEAISRAKENLGAYGQRLATAKASFADLPEVLERHGWGLVDGIVADLGVSSFQLDDPLRGFSFLRDGPLDMRMDRRRSRTAADLVNGLPETDLADLIFNLGEERWARRIARAVVNYRNTQPLSSTLELAQLIKSAVPKTRDALRIHPATRTFQALRIAVNGELEALDRFLSHALDLLKPRARLCIVAFHSLEDRMVKIRFREWSRPCRCPRELLRCECEGHPLVKLLTRKALRPSEDEIESNPRARSARLRAIEKM